MNGLAPRAPVAVVPPATVVPPAPTAPTARRRWLAPLLLIPAALSAWAAAGCGASNRPAFNLGTLSPAERSVVEAGEVFHEGVRPAVVDDGYLQQVGERLVDGARAAKVADTKGGDPKGDWTLSSNGVAFHLVRSNVPNVFTVGGRHVYLYQGLLKQCRSEDDLAAVLAHGFAHVHARHAERRVHTGTGAEQIAVEVLDRPYDAAQEADADGLAVRSFAQGGWDLKKLVLFTSGKTDPARNSGVEKVVEDVQANPPNRGKAIKGVRPFNEWRDQVLAQSPPDPSQRKAPWQILDAMPACFPAAIGPEGIELQKSARDALREHRLTPIEKLGVIRAG